MRRVATMPDMGPTKDYQGLTRVNQMAAVRKDSEKENQRNSLNQNTINKDIARCQNQDKPMKQVVGSRKEVQASQQSQGKIANSPEPIQKQGSTHSRSSQSKTSNDDSPLNQSLHRDNFLTPAAISSPTLRDNRNEDEEG